MLAPAAAPLSFSLKPQIYFQGLLECLLVQTKLLIRAQDESSSPPAYNENRLTGCFVLQRYIPVLLLLNASSYPVESQNGKGRAFITPLQQDGGERRESSEIGGKNKSNVHSSIDSGYFWDVVGRWSFPNRFCFKLKA